MQSQKRYLPALIAAIIFLVLTFLPLVGSEKTLDAFVREDGIFEDLTVLYLLGNFIVFGAALIYFRPSSWLMKLSLLGLALLFFFGAGEEISWGERIFEWHDHNLIKDLNVQQELTIHNLKYFQGEESVLPVSFSQLFTLFVFVMMVVIPLGCLLFPKVRQFVVTRFPILPWQFGILFVLVFLAQKIMPRVLSMFPGLYHHSSMPIPQGVHEIREHGYTFVLLLAAAFYFMSEWNARKVALVEKGENPNSTVYAGNDPNS